MANEQLKEEIRLIQTRNRQRIDSIKLERVARGESESTAEASVAQLRKDLDATTKTSDLLRQQNATIRTETSNYRAATTQQARDGVDAFAALSTGTRYFSDQLVGANARLQDMSAERVESVRAIAEVVGGSSRMFIATANDAKTASKQIQSAQKDLKDEVVNYYKEIGFSGPFEIAKISDAQAEFIAGVNNTDEAFLNAQGAMTEFYGVASGFKEGAGGQLVRDDFFRVQGVPLMDVMGGTIEAFRPFLDILQDDNLRQPFARDMLNPADLDKSLQDLKRMDVAIKGLGMTSDQVRELVRQNYIRDGEATADYFKQVVKAAELGQSAFGYNAQLIVSDIMKMTQNIDTFGFRSADEFAKISAKAHDLHISINELQGVMGKFDTFESAAQTVGQLNSALGTNFDAMELMTLKYEDPALMLEKLREGLTSTGKSFDEIPITYKRMITQQLGITMEGLRGLLDGNVRSLEELSTSQEKATADYQGLGDTEEERQAILDAKVEQRVKINSQMFTSAQSIHDQAVRSAKIFANTGLELSETSLRLNDTVGKIAATYTEKMGGAYKTVLSGAKEVESQLSKVAAGIAVSSMDAISKELTTLATKVVNEMFDAIADQLEKLGGPATAGDIRAARAAVGKQQKAVTPAGDLYVSPGGSTVVTADFGEFNQQSFILDKRDELIARPPPEKTANAPVAAPPPAASKLPAVSDAVRASLQSVGTSLRIELDVGQLTDLVLRDIMMNKPNIFGGLG